MVCPWCGNGVTGVTMVCPWCGNAVTMVWTWLPVVGKATSSLDYCVIRDWSRSKQKSRRAILFPFRITRSFADIFSPLRSDFSPALIQD